jgi:YrbI family 3-deoxy-D-manno-octulosonate 8-phosphate phosphatase
LREVGGRTLVARAVSAALASTVFDCVVVTTDSPDISAEARRCGASVVERPAELATDTATSESGLLHALDEIERERGAVYDVVAFVQCTSPFVDSALLARAVEMVGLGRNDVVFSAVPSHAFIWRDGRDGGVGGVNHDVRVRQRRQDREAEYLETGAFYVMNRNGFVDCGHRFFGLIGVVESTPLQAIEIDTWEDLAIAQRLASIADPVGLAAVDWGAVGAFVMDFDGVHTDNAALLSETGTESVRINRSDGLGIARLRRSGLRMLLLSTEKNAVVETRAAKLGLECVSGCDDKLSELRRWAIEREVEQEHIAYLGNDVNDADCLEWVGVPIIVADAHPELLMGSNFVTINRGGDGAVREVADHLGLVHMATTMEAGND